MNAAAAVANAARRAVTKAALAVLGRVPSARHAAAENAILAAGLAAQVAVRRAPSTPEEES